MSKLLLVTLVLSVALHIQELAAGKICFLAGLYTVQKQAFRIKKTD